MYCEQCAKWMCEQCREETSAEIAAKHGSVRWDQRKDALTACREHGLVVKKPKNGFPRCHKCDICRRKLTEGAISTPCCYTNNNNYDICGDCAGTEEGKKKIVEKDLEMCIPFCEQVGYGSMLDWVPILKDTAEEGDYDGGTVYYNHNEESDNHGKLALSTVDDHGRMGYFSLDKDTTLASLLQTLTELQKQFDQEFADDKYDSWSKYYSRPINRYLESLGHPVYYG